MQTFVSSAGCVLYATIASVCTPPVAPHDISVCFLAAADCTLVYTLYMVGFLTGLPASKCSGRCIPISIAEGAGVCILVHMFC